MTARAILGYVILFAPFIGLLLWCIVGMIFYEPSSLLIVAGVLAWLATGLYLTRDIGDY